MVSVQSRCTQCGTVNTNDVDSNSLNHGGGKAHGTETVFCEECSGSCHLDECEQGDPCDRCHEETLQNRCGSSVPTANE